MVQIIKMLDAIIFLYQATKALHSELELTYYKNKFKTDSLKNEFYLLL
jgi:hypothetical protein